MGAAVALRDIVGEAQRDLARAVVPPHCQLDTNPFLLLADQADRRPEQRLLALVKPLDEGNEAAAELEKHLLRRDVTIILQRDGQAGVQKGKFAQPAFQHSELVFGLGESAAARLEGHLSADRGIGRADHPQRLHRIAMLEADEMLRTAAPDPHLHPLGQRVHHRRANPVQAARDLVGILVELAASMQAGQHHLGRRNAFLFMHVDRDAATIIADGNRAIAVQRHLHAGGKARLRLIDRVVDDLEGHVMQPRAVIGIADVHAGPLADGL